VAASKSAEEGSRARDVSEGSSAPTIVALSSTPGPAPRGVVRISGPDAFEIAARSFIPDVPGPLGRGFRAGSFVLDRRGSACPAHLWCFEGPASYTGEDVIEVHSFGAPKLLDMIVRRLVGSGARLAAPGEFTRRALLNGKIDLTRAEAVCAIIRARDEDEHRKARALLEGGLARAIATFVDRLVALLVPIELQLDFSDQDVVIVQPADHAARIRALAADLATFHDASRPEARRIWPRVVLRGPANAGKSSLFNALLRDDVALATPMRGTTRDVLCAEWRHGDARALLVDTAGDDVTGSAIDDLAHDARERALLEADLVLEVRDVRTGGWPPPSGSALPVATMADLPGARAPRHGEAAVVSNVTGEGMDRLRERIVAALAASAGERGAPFLVTARHSGQLREAERALDRAASAAGSLPAELVASDLRAALRALRGVVGAEDGDPVLDRIFSEFCIGK
jgi:tRNA modification GTPase